MFDSNDDLLISIYKNDDRVYLLKTKFRKILLFLFTLFIALFLGLSFFLLYLINYNKNSDLVSTQQYSLTKPDFDLKNIELSELKTGIMVNFSIVYKENLNLRVLVLGISENKIITHKPVFDLFSVFSNNTCNQGEKLLVYKSYPKKASIILPYEKIKSFDRIAIFICDTEGKLNTRYKEINITKWSNNNALR